MSLNCEPSELTPLRQNINDSTIIITSNSSNSNKNTNNSNNYQRQIQLTDQHQQLSQRQFSEQIVPLQSTIPSEYMSINNNNHHPMGSDSSRVDISEPNSQQAFNPKSNFIMSDTSRILTRIIIDFAVLLCVGLPILAFFLWGEPYKRGFFCDDESIKHPYLDSTVKSWMLYLSGLVLPIALISATEFIQTKLNNVSAKINLVILGWTLPSWIINAYRQIGVFGFGAAASQLTTDIAKYSIGRLRPHFFSVCQPKLMDGTDCSNPNNWGKYIEEFTCIGQNSSERMLKEMRLSFPSGHSSFSVYTMLYCAIYLQYRMTWRGSKLFKHFIQFCLIMMAWFTCMSRISNYKHHWSDVLAGASIGAVTAALVASFIADLSYRRNRNDLLNGQLRCELGAHNTNNGTINA